MQTYKKEDIPLGGPLIYTYFWELYISGRFFSGGFLISHLPQNSSLAVLDILTAAYSWRLWSAILHVKYCARELVNASTNQCCLMQFISLSCIKNVHSLPLSFLSDLSFFHIDPLAPDGRAPSVCFCLAAYDSPMPAPGIFPRARTREKTRREPLFYRARSIFTHGVKVFPNFSPASKPVHSKSQEPPPPWHTISPLSSGIVFLPAQLSLSYRGLQQLSFSTPELCLFEWHLLQSIHGEPGAISSQPLFSFRTCECGMTPSQK